MEPMQVTFHAHTCLRCGKSWLSPLPELKACRFCKSYLWREPRAPKGGH